MSEFRLKLWSFVRQPSLEIRVRFSPTVFTNKQSPIMALSGWILVSLFRGTLILTTNISTTVIFWRRRSTLKRATYLLINLALADMLVGLGEISLCVVSIVFKGVLWKEHGAVSFFSAFMSFACTSSICSLAVIAVERAYAITKPMRHRTVSTAYYWRGILFVWIISALISSLIGVRSLAIAERYKMALRCVTASILLLLLVVICVSYCSILWATSKRSPALGQRDLQNRKLANTLFIVTFFSLATVIPGVTATLLPKTTVSFHVFYLLVFIEFSNSLINPFVYALRMPEFRGELKRLCAGLIVNCARTREEVIPMADMGARGVALKSVETLSTRASAIHTGICTGAALNQTVQLIWCLSLLSKKQCWTRSKEKPENTLGNFWLFSDEKEGKYNRSF